MKSFLTVQYPPLLLLRGLGRSTVHWGPFLDELITFLPKDRVETIDLAGNGSRVGELSFLQLKNNVYDLRERSKWVRARQRPVIVAVSLGAMVAAEWARLFPRDLSGLVLINTSFGELSPPWERLQPQALKYFVHILKHRWENDPLGRELSILRMVSNQSWEFKKRWAARFATQKPPSVYNLVRQLTAAVQYQGYKVPPKIPVLLLASQGDRMVSSKCSEAIQSFWNCSLISHPWAGHELPLDDANWTAEQVRLFLQSLIHFQSITKKERTVAS